ncbi:MAG: 50S ribosomal protein L24 [Candidatus Acetothermia bacterium]|jgi:large subunit ribosomal protein L24|nr:50S ribosomal protein L24 [Candidatus Acetothermia bacterium]MDH7505542.1 50S ribosomal protein L24 [Candidatus Acetothermia bacterium]
MRKVRKGDLVKVIAGRDRGKVGEVLRVFPAEDRIMVKGVHMVKRHQRPTARQREGGIIEQEGKIHLSNVLLICPECDTPTRVGFALSPEGEKLRKCKQCGRTFP